MTEEITPASSDEAVGSHDDVPEPFEAPMADESLRSAQEELQAASGSSFASEPPDPEIVAETAHEFLAGLLAAAELEAEVVASVNGDSAMVEITGEAMGVLIGRRGQTLDAVQELTRTAVQHRLKARVRIVVDIEGYRARRQASLADYASAMAERAKARGTEIELEPMSAYERKIVHNAVAEVDGASSYSEGEEPQRKVIIRGEE
jgi:spoIIIJ-associated protein